MAGSSVTEHIVALAFIFATVYGLAFLYTSSEGQPFNEVNIDETDGRLVFAPSAGFETTLTGYIIDYLLELTSIFSPFILFKYLLYSIMPKGLFDILNLFILRPAGWVISWIWLEWVINKVRGSSET